MPPVIEHPPVKPITKLEFKAPLDTLERTAELKGLKLPVLAHPLPLDPKLLLGTWFNVDKATGGLVRLEITSTAAGLFVHGFGACTPTPCNWSTVPAKMFADSVISTTAVGFTAQFNFSFVETLVVGHIEFGALFVETFDHFIDGSGREDYTSVFIMSK
jgi:hypothetical protein